MHSRVPSCLPAEEEISALLRVHLLEKAIYELGYELNNRPTWVAIPLAGISRFWRSKDSPQQITAR